jgi:hypothetical protein
MTKRKFICMAVAATLIITIALCLLAGCGGLETVTTEKPFGSGLDPNAVAPWIDMGKAIGGGIQATGTATGRPDLMGAGLLVTTLAGIIGTILVGKKGKDEK